MPLDAPAEHALCEVIMLIEVEVHLGKIPDQDKLLLILREKSGPRFMIFSVENEPLKEILIALFDIPTDRPATHAAWAAMAFEAHIVLEKFVIDMIDDKKQLLCHLRFRQGSRTWKVECRPSDGIALALHLDAPLMCRDSLFTVLSAGNTETVPVSAEEYLSTKETEEDEVSEKLRIFSAFHPDIPKA
jgi:bifunctional DNase/RNase